MERELQDLRSLEGRRCSLRLSLLFPGLGPFCTGDTAQGLVLSGLGAVELTTGILVALRHDVTWPGAAVPLLGFADLLTAAALSDALRVQRAQRLPYVPQESLAEAFAAPFRLDVLGQPDVWLGIVGAVGLGVAYDHLVGGAEVHQPFSRPQLFGSTLHPAVGYPAAGAIGVGLFAQVAVAEELAFRGLLQSDLTRSWGETRGLLFGSLAFGLFHASNVLFLAPEQRVDYLVKSVPFITLVGAYLGWEYRRHGYGLSAPIAVHFWYDFLLEAVALALDPKNSPLSVSFAF